jgi:hypothetical protein
LGYFRLNNFRFIVGILIITVVKYVFSNLHNGKSHLIFPHL